MSDQKIISIPVNIPAGTNSSNTATGTQKEVQTFNYTPDEPQTYGGKEPEFVDQKTVTVKGDDGKKYKADQVITREVDANGKTWEVSVTTYTDASGNAIKDTEKKYVRTEKFGKENVDITTSVSVHETPKGKRTVNAEESKYHYKATTENIEYLENGGRTKQIKSSSKSKKKVCQMPEGFSSKYLSTTVEVGRFENGKFITTNQ